MMHVFATTVTLAEKFINIVNEKSRSIVGLLNNFQSTVYNLQTGKQQTVLKTEKNI